MGYYYPLIDYGQVHTNKKHWSYKAFRPALFVREYLDKIITGTGYTYDSFLFLYDKRDGKNFIDDILMILNNYGMCCINSLNRIRKDF